ncbi:MAG: hypothetical protein ACPLXR_02110 [Halothiobacillaceae bacterium]
MPWLECCSDGRYRVAERTYILEADALIAEDEIQIKAAQDETGEGITLYPFSLETEHGVFRWHVEVIQYYRPSGETMKGFSLTESPQGVVITDQVMFVLYNGWRNDSIH